MINLSKPSLIVNELLKIHRLRTYLEIGPVSNNFDRIQLKDDKKISLGQSGSLFEFKSKCETASPNDEAKQHPTKFDLIFIDYPGSYAQVKKNYNMAKSLLSKKGIILLYRTNPPKGRLAGPEFKKGPWCGEVYKLACELRGDQNVTIVTLNVYWGITIVNKYKDNNNLELDIPEFIEFENQRSNYLNLIDTKSYETYLQNWKKCRDKPIEELKAVSPKEE